MRRTLTDADVDAIARRVAELLEPRAGGATEVEADLTVKDVAERLGVKTSFVYANARELGGYKLKNTPRGRWRFNPNALPGPGSDAQVPERTRGGRRRRGRADAPPDPTFGGLFGPRERS